MRSPEDKNLLLGRLHDAYRDCERCPLARPTGRRRMNVVLGEGNPGARVMIVGESPGYYSDTTGRPMIDEDGTAIINPLLEGINSSRDEVFITTLVSCRPTAEDRPNLDRAPTKEEIRLCQARLHSLIDIVDPYVIITMGQAAMKTLTGCKRTLLQVARDKTLPMLWAETPGHFVPVKRTAYATFHPGYLLKQFRDMGEDRFYAPGSDMHHTFLTFHRAFSVADQHAFMNYGTPHPDRGGTS